MPAIIRVLWGNPTSSIQWIRVKKDVTRQVASFTVPQFAYVYGHENYNMLVKLGMDKLQIVLVHDNPYPDGKKDKRRGRYLMLPWHYKLELIRRALEHHDEIVYCDWDVDCFATSLSEVFHLLTKRDFTLSAYLYRKPRHPKRETNKEKRIGVSGNWIHLRGFDFLDEVVEEMKRTDTGLGNWHDEIAMGNLLDRKYGGWMGEETWLKKYESPIMVQQSHRCPWPAVADDGRTVAKKTPIPFTWTRLFTQLSRQDLHLQQGN